MKIKYLGTAAAEGIPAIFCECDVCKRALEAGGKNIRTRSQALIDGKLLVDFPADTYMHMLMYKLNFAEIEHCIITHSHKDHVYPGDLEMRSHNLAHTITERPALNVYGTRPVERAVIPGLYERRMLENNEAAFIGIKPFIPFEAGGYRITPLQATHDVLSGPVIYAVENDGKTLLYGNDTCYFCEETWSYLKDNKLRFDYVSLDCTGGINNLNYKTHMNLDLCIKTKKRLLDIGSADDKTIFCLNHFSHHGGGVIYDDFVPIAEKAGFIVSYDGMEIEI